MRVRISMPAAFLAATLSTGLAWSQGPPAAPPAASPPPATASTAPAGADGAMDIFGVSRFFTAPASLGDAWERAVRTALDRMRTFLEAERATALATSTPPKRVAVRVLPAPPPAEGRSAQRPVRVHPVKVEPVTQSVVDARGQSAVLLGGSVELPWTVP